MSETPGVPDRSRPAYGPGPTGPASDGGGTADEERRGEEPGSPAGSAAEAASSRSARLRGRGAVAGIAVVGLVVLMLAVLRPTADTSSAPPGDGVVPTVPDATLPAATVSLLRGLERIDGVAAAGPFGDGGRGQAGAGVSVELVTPFPGPVQAQAVADEVLAVVESDGGFHAPVTFEATMPGSAARIAVTYVADAAGAYASLGADPVSDAVVLLGGAHPVGRVTQVRVTPEGGSVQVSDAGTLRAAADEARRLHLPAGSFRVDGGPGEWLATPGPGEPGVVPPDAGLAMIEQVAVIEDVTTAIYVPRSGKNAGQPYLEVIIQADPAPLAELLDAVGYADQLGFPVAYKVWGIDETGETSRTGWVSGRTADTGHGVDDGRADDGVPGVASCTADVVRVELPWTDAATGQRYLGVRATNRSDTPCALGRRPDVSFLAADGSVPDILVEPVGDAGAPVVLDPGESADSMLQWGAGSTAGGVVLTTAVLVTLPGDDRPVRLPVTDVEHVVGGIDLLAGARARLDPWRTDTP